MEKDTVNLNVNAYNELRDFKKQIEEGNVVVVRDDCYTKIRYLSKDKAVKQIGEVNESLQKKLDDCSKKLDTTKEELRKNGADDKRELYNVSNMSIWKFMKWRKKARYVNR